MLEIVVHTDGASRGNPGPAAMAYTISGIDESRVELKKQLGTTTNNQAEYQAMVAATDYLADNVLESATISFFADSELMIKQLRGEYRMKDALLRPHYEKILSNIRTLNNRGVYTSFTAVRRAENKRADELCNLALDGQGD